MTFTGVYVLARTTPDLDLAGVLAQYGGTRAGVGRGEEWSLARVDDPGLYDEAEAVVDDLLDRTGEPVLLALCVEGEFAVVTGVTGSGEVWYGALARAAALTALTDAEDDADGGGTHTHRGAETEGGAADLAVSDPEAVAVLCPPPDEALRGALAWAGEAGTTPDRDVLTAVLADDADPGGAVDATLWPRLLAGLGVHADVPAAANAGSAS